MKLNSKKRVFLPQEYQITDWNTLQVFYDSLVERKLESKAGYQQWLVDKSELESVISEDFAWRYIRMTCDTQDENKQNDYKFFVENIQPQLATYEDKLNHLTLKYHRQWPLNEPGYDIMIRGIEESVKIFREENVGINTEIQLKEADYQAITGSMTVQIDQEEMTLQKAATFLQNTDRTIRENAWKKISDRRYKDHALLDQNFSEMLQLRNQVAHNANFSNFRDYMFSAMGRFDYTPQDCFDFHQAIEKTVVPLAGLFEKKRKEDLKLAGYRPWDTQVDTSGKAALRPFEGGDDLLDKSEKCFENISPLFRDYLKIMRDMGHFDVVSRKGKAPGGYNYPLEETGVPFIFMNATHTVRDMVTIVHEGGHAIHSFETRDLPINAYRNPPMEVAELASMAMELISMEHWDAYFENPEDLKRAKKEHLTDIISTLPWIATVDSFQHWIYENPEHSLEERSRQWMETLDRFGTAVIDWSGLENYRKYSWQKQLHIFEVPFYYIEYGMAQLGAISVWRNYKKNPSEGLNQYLAALRLGYTRNIKEIYKTAGIKFDFSEAYISELMGFVHAEILKLED